MDDVKPYTLAELDEPPGRYEANDTVTLTVEEYHRLLATARASSGRPTEAVSNDRLAGIVERMSVVDMDDAGPSKVTALDHATLSDPDGKAIVLTNEDFWKLHAAASAGRAAVLNTGPIPKEWMATPETVTPDDIAAADSRVRVMNITPLRNLILVTLEDTLPELRGGIEIVRLQREPSHQARVIAVGPEVRETRVGQHVLVSRLQGIEIGGSILLPEGAVLAYLEDV